MDDDLFARAKGPRRTYPDLQPDEEFVCPWCGGTCPWRCSRWREDVHRYITVCPSCEREFLCPDERGELVCVGLLSPADMKYLAAKEGAAHDR
ncbi:hypothetical protein [Azospirillum sp.]|uniref:hypothetical protein n=1 Tax=Azospirillum sp. TaxID=34012 RepID=UPI003D70CB90